MHLSLEDEEMVLNVASTHKGHFATKTEGRTVKKEYKEKGKRKKDYVSQESPP
jgi:hypothetical protein